MEQAAQRGEWHGRVVRLQEQMRKAGLDACLITQNVDIYYITGSMQTGYVWVPADGEAVFFVRRSLIRAQQESQIPVLPLGSFRQLAQTLASQDPRLLQQRSEPLRIGTELDVLPAQLYLKLQELLTAAAPGSAALLVDGSAVMRSVRMVKSAYEIVRIEHAAAVVDEALQQSLDRLVEGVTELQWIAELERQLRLRGHIGLMRMRGYNQEIMTGMVGSGAAAAEPSYFDGPAGGRGLGPFAPQSVSRKRIGRNEPILIDIGCCVDGYVIDQSRTAVIGELPEDLHEAYQLSERILRQAEAAMLPGTPSETIYTEALQQVQNAGMTAYFMGCGADQVKFLGHGIGLEIDEWPVLANGFKQPLQSGMVLAVEPKFCFPGRGVVGIENSYVITEQGPKALTRSPEGLIVLPL